MLSSLVLKSTLILFFITVKYGVNQSCPFFEDLFIMTIPHDKQGSGLQIGIVGAGVAGLTSAIALLKIGHSVEVGRMSSLRQCSIDLPHVIVV